MTGNTVTGCVSGGRFSLEGGPREARCVGDMAYRWKLTDDTTELTLQLADGIVPMEFLKLLDKPPATDADKERLEAHKRAMTEAIWRMPLETAFPEKDLKTKALKL
jgi:hypothetical protein